MAAMINALYLLAAIAFMVVSYATNGSARAGPGDTAAPLPRFSLSPRYIYRASVWMAPISLAGLALHITSASVLQLGPGPSLLFLPCAAALLIGAGWLALQLWRQH